MSKSHSLWLFPTMCYVAHLTAMPGSDYYFFLLKCSLCQIRRLKSHKFLLCCGRETWQTARCSKIDQCLQFMMCLTSLAGKCLPLTTTNKPSQEVNKKSNMLIFLSWGCKGVLEVASVVVHYMRWNDWLFHLMLLIDRFWTHLTPYGFPVGLLCGWFRVVWPRH